MFDVITIGSAVKDVFFLSKDFKIIKSHKVKSGVGICLNFGSKIEIKDIRIDTGGGATNTAVSFSRLGLKTAIISKIGLDIEGIHILRELKKENINTSLITTSKKHQTGYSIILSQHGERTVLVYRGANIENDAKKLEKTKWFYISPLTGKSELILKKTIQFARKNNIKIAFNPSKVMLKKGFNKLRYILNHVDVLMMNREEGSILTNLPYKDDKKIFNKLCQVTKGIIVLTEGKKGVLICNGKYKYKANSPKIKVIDTLGAGDSFGSAFVTGIIKKNDIEHAIKLGITNACSVLQHIGAKKGLIKYKDIKKYKVFMNKIKIKKTKI